MRKRALSLAETESASKHFENKELILHGCICTVIHACILNLGQANLASNPLFGNSIGLKKY